MTREEICRRLKELLKSNQFMSLRNLVEAVDEDTSLINDLALDSIQILELIVAMEKEFLFTCEAEELNLDLFDRFGSLVEFVHAKVNREKDYAANQ